MTGSLKIKNGKYYAVLNLKIGGEYKQKWVSTKLDVKGNKRKATEFLNNLISEYEEKEKSLSDDPGDILFTSYMLKWLEFKENKVEATTFDRYKIVVEKHLQPYFEPLNLKIKDLKRKTHSRFL